MASGNYFKKLAMIESGGDPLAKAKTSSATGLFQFIDKTWKNTVKDLGKKYTLEDRTDPKKSLEVVKQFTKNNEAYLKKHLKRNPTDAELYMAHFLGPGGAKSFIKNKEKTPNNSANTNHEEAANSNKSIFYKDGNAKSYDEVFSSFEKKLSKYDNKIKNNKIPSVVNNLNITSQTNPSSKIKALSKLAKKPEETYNETSEFDMIGAHARSFEPKLENWSEAEKAPDIDFNKPDIFGTSEGMRQVRQKPTLLEEPMEQPELSQEEKLKKHRQDHFNKLEALRRLKSGMKHGGIVYAEDGDAMDVMGTNSKPKPKPIFGDSSSVTSGGFKPMSQGSSSSGTGSVGGSGVAQNAVADQTPGPSEKKGSGSFTNISKYIDANKPATQKMSEEVVGKVTDKTQDLKSDVQNKTEAKLEEARNIREDLGGEASETMGGTQDNQQQDESINTGTESDSNTFQDQAIEDAMSGKSFDTDTDQGSYDQERFRRLEEGSTVGPDTVDFSDESGRMDALKQISENVGTSEGRAGLLKENVNHSGYTRGQAGLDSYLFGRDPSVRGENITAIQNKVSAVRENLKNSKEMLAPIPDEIRQKVADVSKNIRAKIQEKIGGITSTSEEDATAYNKAKAEYGEFLDGTSDGISQEAADILGLKAGQETFGMNSSSLGSDRFGGGMVDQAGFDKLNALSQLSGKDVTATTEDQVGSYISPADQMVEANNNMSAPVKAAYEKYAGEENSKISADTVAVREFTKARASTDRNAVFRAAGANGWNGRGGWNNAAEHVRHLIDQANARIAQAEARKLAKAKELNRRTLSII